MCPVVCEFWHYHLWADLRARDLHDGGIHALSVPRADAWAGAQLAFRSAGAVGGIGVGFAGAQLAAVLIHHVAKLTKHLAHLNVEK